MCSDEEGSELADLQRVLQRVVSSKKASARQKQAAIIQVGARRHSLPDRLIDTSEYDAGNQILHLQRILNHKTQSIAACHRVGRNSDSAVCIVASACLQL